MEVHALVAMAQQEGLLQLLVQYSIAAKEVMVAKLGTRLAREEQVKAI